MKEFSYRFSFASSTALISHNTLIQQGRLVSQSSGAIGAALYFMQAYLARATGDLA